MPPIKNLDLTHVTYRNHTRILQVIQIWRKSWNFHCISQEENNAGRLWFVGTLLGWNQQYEGSIFLEKLVQLQNSVKIIAYLSCHTSESGLWKLKRFGVYATWKGFPLIDDWEKSRDHGMLYGKLIPVNSLWQPCRIEFFVPHLVIVEIF
jgi:hypothetical protein